MYMASTTGYDLPVRQALRERGISDADIGYDKATGYVTIRGQPFMQPARVYMGTSYANQQDFETAWQNYLRSQQTTNQPQINVPKTTTQPQTVSAQPATSRTTPDYSSIYNIGNPYDQRVAEAISSLQSLIQQIQQPVSLESIYSSPQYEAFRAQAQKQAEQGIRAAQEALGAAGFGRSTLLGERAQEIQNLANEYLQTQVLPQLIAAEEARRQAQLENALAFIRQLAQQQAVMEGRYESAAERALREAQLTGQYLPAEARALIDSLLELKRQAEAPGITAEARSELSSQANEIRARLAGMGVDTSLFSADVPYAQAIQNVARAGTPTLAAREFEFERDTTMAQLTGRLPDGTPTTAEQQRQLQNLWAIADATGVIPDQLADMYGIPRGTPTQAAKQFALQYNLERRRIENAIANANADNARQDAAENFRRLIQIWEATGSAPSGLEAYGVSPGTPWRPYATSGQGNGINMRDEVQGLVNALRSNEITPTEAYRQIEEDASLGLYTPEQAAALKQVVETMAPNMPQPELTEEQRKSLPSDAEIDKIWEKEGKPKGYPKLDFRSWYKSPNGRLAGVPFETWYRLYGPRMID